MTYRVWDGDRWLTRTGEAWAIDEHGPRPPPGRGRREPDSFWVIASVGFLVGGLAIGWGIASWQHGQPTTVAPAQAAAVASVSATGTGAAAASTAPNPGALSDQGWTVMQIRTTDTLGSFTGSLRVRNDTGGPASDPSFTVSVLKGGSQVASLVGADAGTASSGKVITVQLVSSDKWVPGPYTFEFQSS